MKFINVERNLVYFVGREDQGDEGKKKENLEN